MWLQGRTVLIPMEGCQGKADQYRPITCLNTCYKLLTAVMSIMIADHVRESDIMPAEKKALRKGRRGCLDALLVDQAVVGEARAAKKALSVSWIDYSKAFDRVPHGWLDLVLRTTGVPGKVRRCLLSLMLKWRSEFEVGRGDVVRIDLAYKRGLFQGDSLSPLLFCLCIAPISHGLRESRVGFRSAINSGMVSHLFYVDDLKVYATTRVQLEGSLELVDRVSKAVGMELGLRKCGIARLNAKSGKAVWDEGMKLPGDRTIATVTDAYRYLGVDQLLKANVATVKRRLKEKYVARLHKVWSSRLNGKNKVAATNSWAVSTFSYFFGCLKWSRGELDLLDKKTRAVIRQHRSAYRGASMYRLYLPRRDGGRGILSIVSTWERALVSAVAYLLSSSSLDLGMVAEYQQWAANRGRYCIVGQARKVLKRYDLHGNDN